MGVAGFGIGAAAIGLVLGLDTVGSAPRSSRAMSEAVAEVACGSMSVARRKKLATCTGFDPTPEGLLNDTELISAMDLPNNPVLDWMHCLLRDGAMNSMLAQYVAEIGGRRMDGGRLARNLFATVSGK